MQQDYAGDALPHWQLDTIYPGLESDAFTTDFDTWTAAIDQLTAYFDAHQIDLRDSATPSASMESDTLDTAISELNRVQQLGHQLYAYVMGFVSTDSRNLQAQTWMSRLQIVMAELEKLEPRFVAWVGGLDLESAIQRSELVRDHAYILEKAQIQAAHLMSPAEESLAAELNVTGGRAWSKFYSNFSSQITATVEIEGEPQTLPMTTLRNLAYEPDRDLRRRAYEAELAAWEAHAMPIAAAMNSIKGQANTLNRRRGWASPRDVALFNNAITGATLDAMLETAKDYFPQFRRYLKAKAQALNIDRCAWYDLFAPVGHFERTWTFDAAQSFIIEQFGSFSGSLRGLAERAFNERWIDAEPRAGKRGGAFCMWVRADESRILSNFQQSYGGMSTLAHELGHAYHNLNLSGRSYMQHDTPMTLAETASTFCQIIVRNAALAEASQQEQLAILEADLQDSTQVIVDITSRFLFESEVFQQRKGQELSADELSKIMLESQRATYGDGLADETRHPYMWAAKPHYYSSVFYNFPYMFGLLFGLGVYARYREDTGSFVARYEGLLSSTGMESADTLARRFGIDITGPAFWEGSLRLIVEDIDRFEALVNTTVKHQPGI
jgi:oligoendopeptidase F